MSPDHLDDDAVSALLDGEATLDEAAHAEGCDICSARVAELRGASVLLAAPPPPPAPEVREAAIAAALAARVVPLSSRRRPAPTWLLSAAAVIVLALIVVPLLGDRGSDDRDQLAGGDSEVTEDAPAASEESTADDSAAGTMALRAADPVAAGDLGVLDEASVADRVTAALGDEYAVDRGQDGDAATTPAPSAGGPCEDTLRSGDPELGDLRLSGTATVDGRGGFVVAYDLPGTDPPALRAYVVTGDGCEILLSSTFPAPERVGG